MENSTKKHWIRKHHILLAIVLAVLIVLFFMYKTIDNPPPPEEINLNSGTDTSAQSQAFELGKHLALKNCARCHGADLHGGTVKEESGEVELAADITRSGVCSTYSENDFRRALRLGMHPDGTPLSPVMLAIESRNLSDEEVHAVYLYTRGKK